MKTYAIPKGRNYSREWWRKRLLWKPTGMRAILRFDPSMIYESENDGWQKLCGFSRGHHHDNSFRFVWRCWDGFFEIGAYQYNNGFRYAELIYQIPIGRITIGSVIDMDISIGDDNMALYRVKANNCRYYGSIFFAYYLHPFGYTLHPYYEDPKSNPTTAPHDIKFQMEVEYF